MAEFAKCCLYLALQLEQATTATKNKSLLLGATKMLLKSLLIYLFIIIFIRVSKTYVTKDIGLNTYAKNSNKLFR